MIKKLLFLGAVMLQSAAYCAADCAEALDKMDYAIGQEEQGKLDEAYENYLVAEQKLKHTREDHGDVFLKDLLDVRKRLVGVCFKQGKKSLYKVLPFNAHEWFLEAEHYFAIVKRDKSLTQKEFEIIEACLNKVPTLIESCVQSALARGIENSDKEVALVYLKQAVECGSCEAIFELGQLSYAEKKFDKAICCYRRAAEKGHVVAMLQLAEICASNKRFDLSREWQECAKQIKPYNAFCCLGKQIWYL